MPRLNARNIVRKKLSVFGWLHELQVITEPPNRKAWKLKIVVIECLESLHSIYCWSVQGPRGEQSSLCFSWPALEKDAYFIYVLLFILWQNAWQKQFKQEKLYFGSQFSASWMEKQGVRITQWGHHGGQETEMPPSTRLFPPFVLFFQSGNLAPEMVLPIFRAGLCSIKPSGNAFTDCPEVYLM